MVTPISEIIFSGFVSKIVNNGVDASWTKIKKVIKSKKAEYQNMESQIYNIIVNALNQITFYKFENNQDKIYQAAEKLLLGYNDIKSDDIKILRSGLQVLGENVNNDKYIEFKGLIYDEIGKKENVELYHTILLWLLEQKNKYDQLEIEQLNQKLDAVLQILGTKEMKSNPQHVDIKREIKSRTQEYADKWNANMFLNDFEEWDENAGVNVKLSEVYLEEHLPHYIWGSNKYPRNDLKKLLSNHIDKKIGNKMLLILGQPGIGKSTLITWITANFTCRVDDFLVYQFAADLKDIDWRHPDCVKQILDILNLSCNDLNGKTLFLDGFDEISAENNRKDILNGLFENLIYRKDIEKFTLIITCRENYIQDIGRIKCQYIILQPWDEKQIRSFCTIYQQNTHTKISSYTLSNIIENEDILGTPLILYMLLALNISVDRKSSIVDIYDKIFSLDGGIYDRCIENKNFANIHRIGRIKEYVHKISRNIAMWMFENNPNIASISQSAYEKICKSAVKGQIQKYEEIKQDSLIGNYFKRIRHCEGIETEELYFVHRSIYEYFVAEAIYSSVEKNMKEFSEKNQEDFAKNIANCLKQGRITYIIGKYLQYKIVKLYNNLNNDKKDFYKWWEITLEKMMDSGMFYYTGNVVYRNIITKEIVCFLNIIDILRLLLDISENKYIMIYVRKELVEGYVKYCIAESKIFNEYPQLQSLDFSKMFLKRVNLISENLTNVNLTGANLSEAKLVGADLRKTILKQTVMKGADLRNADLRGVDLRGADLCWADLRGTDLRGADLRGACLNNLKNANLQKTDLTKVILKGADLRESNLREVNLTRADLRGANLRDADLWRACLWEVDLRETDLRGIDLRGVSLWCAKLEGSIWLREDILRVISQFKYATFTYIIVQDGLLQKNVSKRELSFDYNTKNSIWGKH